MALRCVVVRAPVVVCGRARVRGRARVVVCVRARVRGRARVVV